MRSLVTDTVPLVTLALAIAATWTTFGAEPAKVPFRPDQGVSIGAQLSFLISHPTAVFSIAANTLRRYADHYYD